MKGWARQLIKAYEKANTPIRWSTDEPKGSEIVTDQKILRNAQDAMRYHLLRMGLRRMLVME